jgi:beta-1,4-mannosyl-glycoprotein beta-1,4-N-acetylglucosaminyltransferase
VIEAIDIDALWSSPLAGREEIAFRRALSDHLTERFAVSKTDRRALVALKQTLTDAWKTNRIETFVGAGLALTRINCLKAPQSGRMAWALLSQNRFGDALTAANRAEDDTHVIWFDRARALAGCKRLDQARLAALTALERLRSDGPGLPTDALVWPLKLRPQTLDRACRWWEARDALNRGRAEGLADPDAPVRDFLERRALLLIEAIEAVSPATAPADWPGAARQATACLLLGLDNQALKVLGAAARKEVAPDSSIDAATLLRTASAAAPAGSQPMLLELFSRLARKRVDRAFVRRAQGVLGGGVPWQEPPGSRPPRPETARMAATALAGSGRLEPAIAMLGELTRGKFRQAEKRDLAACISRQTVADIRLQTSPRPGPPRVFDLFPYNGELGLLKIKLHEMAPWVDRFVIVESAATFTGQPKPLAFPGDRAELGEFLDKITYLPIESFPEHVSSPWAREFYQRDQAVKGLRGLCGPDDIVLLTDVDELVARRTLDRFDGEMAFLFTLTCRYFLNHAALDQRPNSSIWRAAYLERWGPSFARHMLATQSWAARIPDGGWHFTSVGDARVIARKLASYSHEENNRRDSEAVFGELLERIRKEGPEPGWRRAEVEELPAYVQANLEALAELIL